MIEPIRYITRTELDTASWDRCIETASNGLIYAYSFYLDGMARHWDALVYGNYQWVMPLTWNRKWGFYYLYQPAFTASLGIFGQHPSPQTVQEFLKAIPSRFRLTEIDLNAGNLIPENFPSLIHRTNYILNLKNDYQLLYNQYRDNTKRNLKKAQQAGYRYETGVPLEKIIELSGRQMKRISGPGKEDYQRFTHIYNYLLNAGKALSTGIFSPQHELLASAVYFFSNKRAYYILVGNHPNGKTLGASHFLVDQFIQTHAGQDLLLDFEGSDIRNLAFFYSGFGATTEIYPALRINRLPGWVRFLKGG